MDILASGPFSNLLENILKILSGEYYLNFYDELAKCYNPRVLARGFFSYQVLI
jgi:hypothetical protein